LHSTVAGAESLEDTDLDWRIDPVLRAWKLRLISVRLKQMSLSRLQLSASSTAGIYRFTELKRKKKNDEYKSPEETIDAGERH